MASASYSCRRSNSTRSMRTEFLVGTASETSDSWPIADVPQPCRFAFSCSALRHNPMQKPLPTPTMLGFVQSVVRRCWSSKGLQLRTSSYVLHRSRIPSPHETSIYITKLLPASARYLSLCLLIRPFSFPYSPRSSLPHHICAFRNSSSLPFGCCALPCLSG